MAGEPTDRRFWTVVFLASVDFCCVLLATERYDKGDIRIGTIWLLAGIVFSVIGWKWPQIKRTIARFRRNLECEELYSDIVFAWLRANIHTVGTFSAAHLADSIGLPENAVNRGLDLLRSKYQIVTKPSPLVDSWSFAAASSVHLNPKYKMVAALTSSNPIKVSLVPWQGKGEKMFLTVTNLGMQRQAFQGQCRILARRNDPNTPQLITFDLQWEYGGQSYTLAPGQAGNLLIASAGQGEHRDWGWLQLESAGSIKLQRSDWHWGDKLPEYDIEVTILGDGEPQREKFTVRAGKECAIEMGELAQSLPNSVSVTGPVTVLPLVPLQSDAMQLSLELLAFLKRLGPPPAPKYTAEDIDKMTGAQMEVLIKANDGDFLEACEYYRPGGIAFTRQGLENQITSHWTRLLPWYRKVEAAYALELKTKVQTMCNRFLMYGISDNELPFPVEGKDAEKNIRAMASTFWELAYKVGEKGNP